MGVVSVRYDSDIMKAIITLFDFGAEYEKTKLWWS